VKKGSSLYNGCGRRRINWNAHDLSHDELPACHLLTFSSHFLDVFLTVSLHVAMVRSYRLADAFESLVVAQAGGSPGGAGQKSKTRIPRERK